MPFPWRSGRLLAVGSFFQKFTKRARRCLARRAGESHCCALPKSSCVDRGNFTRESCSQQPTYSHNRSRITSQFMRDARRSGTTGLAQPSPVACGTAIAPAAGLYLPETPFRKRPRPSVRIHAGPRPRNSQPERIRVRSVRTNESYACTIENRKSNSPDIVGFFRGSAAYGYWVSFVRGSPPI